MYEETDRHRLFTRRALILGAGQLGLFGVLLGRLWQLQVGDGEKYASLAEDNRVNTKLIVPARGRILDRLGRPLARNVPAYRVRVVRERTPDLRATLEALAELVPVSPRRLEEVERQARELRSFVPVPIRDDLSWEEVARIAVRAPELPGILLDQALLRDYPHGPILAHVLGYVGPVDGRELETERDPLLALPEFRIGKKGIEKRYDRRLRGRAGLSKVEVNALGREIRELEREEGDPGEDLQISLDLDLQRFCFDRLAGEKAAAAAVVDVHTGAVLASVSIPSFDPKPFTNGLTAAAWKKLSHDPLFPLVDKTIRGQYPPGSTFKMVTALAALEKGVIDPSHEVFCSGVFTLGDARFHCWKTGGHGRLALVQAIAQSCDIYFYDVALRVGVDAIADMARRFGLGDRLGIDLPGERPGLIPTRAWKRERLGQPWQKGETVVTGIGQGFVLTTPLQLAVMTARLCNGLRMIRPWFVRPAEAETVEWPRIELPEDGLRAVLRGMYEVVNGARGTARRAKLPIPGITLAGKTGTSQVKRITRAERARGDHKRKDKPWRERDHALFVCYAPFEAPRYAVAVVVEHGGSGSKAAAPPARDIMTRTLEINPSGADLLAARDLPRKG